MTLEATTLRCEASCDAEEEARENCEIAGCCDAMRLESLAVDFKSAAMRLSRPTAAPSNVLEVIPPVKRR